MYQDYLDEATKYSPTQDEDWKPTDDCPKFDDQLKFINIDEFPPKDADLREYKKLTDNIFDTKKGLFEANKN